MKFLFFFMGVPLMIMSFFEPIDVMPYVDSSNLIVNGVEIQLSQEEQQSLQEQIVQMFEKSHTMPAFGVVLNDMYQEMIQDGTYVSLKFDRVFEINDLPFDELVFKVDPSYMSFDLMRGMNGIFQGRCIHIDLMGENMQKLSDFINSLSSVENAQTPVEPEESSDRFESEKNTQETESEVAEEADQQENEENLDQNSEIDFNLF